MTHCPVGSWKNTGRSSRSRANTGYGSATNSAAHGLYPKSLIHRQYGEHTNPKPPQRAHADETKPRNKATPTQPSHGNAREPGRRDGARRHNEATQTQPSHRDATEPGQRGGGQSGGTRSR